MSKMFFGILFVLLALPLYAATGTASAVSGAQSAGNAGTFATNAAIAANPIIIADNEDIGAAVVMPIAPEPENPPLRDFVQNMRVGDIADTGDLRVRLSETGSRNNVRYVIVDIMDGQNNLLAQTTINSGSTYTYLNERMNKRLRVSASQINLQRQSARLNLVESTLHANADRLEVNGEINTGEHTVRLTWVDRNSGEAELEILNENGRVRLERINVMPGTSYYYRDYRANIRLRINVYYSSTEEDADHRWIYISTRENIITQPRDLDVGESFRTAHFSVRLSDVAVAQGENNEHPAILDILDRRGNLLAQTSVNPGSSYMFTSHNQNEPIYTLYVHVYETAPAFNLADKWASISVTEIRG